jgi:hypothetical protein
MPQSKRTIVFAFYMQLFHMTGPILILFLSLLRPIVYVIRYTGPILILFLSLLRPIVYVIRYTGPILILLLCVQSYYSSPSLGGDNFVEFYYFSAS